jgi:hypothetical protein
MTKRRGNPNWGKPDLAPSNPVNTLSSFDEVVKSINLSPDDYVRSRDLREWVRLNRNGKFVPERLLEAWSLDIDETL